MSRRSRRTRWWEGPNASISVSYFASAADAGNMQYQGYLSPAPKMVTIVAMIMPGLQSEGNGRTSLIFMVQDMGFMMKGMPDSVLLQMRKKYE